MRKNNNSGDNKKLLGKRIRELRKRSGLTMAELSEKISIEPSSLGNIENGYNYPLIANLETLAKALNCSISDFFNYEHLAQPNDLQKEINKMLENNPDRIQDVYKLLKGFLG